jgi:hypothetical protein
MSDPNHNPHPKTPDKEKTSVTTPDVGKSSIIKISLFAFLVIIILIILTMVIYRSPNNKKENKNEEKTEVSQTTNTPNYSSNYNISEILQYGNYLEIRIAPKETIRVNLDNDYYPMYSEKEVMTYDCFNTRRVLNGNRFFGPKSVPSPYYLFSNENNSTVLVKIGKCKSVEDCNIKF